MASAVRQVQNGKPNGGPKIDPAVMGGSSGHHAPETSRRLQELMKKMPSILELNKIEGALNGPDGWEKVGVLVGRTSSSMLLTTEQLAEAIPPAYKTEGREFITLEPDERVAAAREEGQVPESEFYGFEPLVGRRQG